MDDNLASKSISMKIQSSELQTQTQHTFYQESHDSKTVFKQMLIPIESTKSSNLYDFTKQIPDRYDDTIYSIIENLISLIHQQMRLNSKVTSRSSVHIHEHYLEEESVSFSTKGIIRTDTQVINIDVDFSMSRSFMIDNYIDTSGQIDPLVININGEIPSLTSHKFLFDLDNDGKKDQISELSQGSGFLALDKNNDGKITEGKELFGTLLGDGFAELSQYDDDNNNWIDENDAIFDKLRIFFNNSQEEKTLVSLGEVGVGAIFLQSQKTEFTYKTSSNEVLGKLKCSGIALCENGNVANISQIDFSMLEREEKKNTPLESLMRA